MYCLFDEVEEKYLASNGSWYDDTKFVTGNVKIKLFLTPAQAYSYIDKFDYEYVYWWRIMVVSPYHP